jgi:hypothetical protein
MPVRVLSRARSIERGQGRGRPRPSATVRLSG